MRKTAVFEKMMPTAVVSLPLDNSNITSSPRLRTGFGLRGPIVQISPREFVVLSVGNSVAQKLAVTVHQNLPTFAPPGDFRRTRFALYAGVLIAQNRAPNPHSDSTLPLIPGLRQQGLSHPSSYSGLGHWPPHPNISHLSPFLWHNLAYAKSNQATKIHSAGCCQSLKVFRSQGGFGW